MKFKEVIGYVDTGTMSNVPLWAQQAIVAGAYQQGKADAMAYTFNKLLEKINQR